MRSMMRYSPLSTSVPIRSRSRPAMVAEAAERRHPCRDRPAAGWPTGRPLSRLARSRGGSERRALRGAAGAQAGDVQRGRAGGVEPRPHDVALAWTRNGSSRWPQRALAATSIGPFEERAGGADARELVGGARRLEPADDVLLGRRRLRAASARSRSRPRSRRRGRSARRRRPTACGWRRSRRTRCPGSSSTCCTTTGRASTGAWCALNTSFQPTARPRRRLARRRRCRCSRRRRPSPCCGCRCRRRRC